MRTIGDQHRRRGKGIRIEGEVDVRVHEFVKVLLASNSRIRHFWDVFWWVFAHGVRGDRRGTGHRRWVIIGSDSELLGERFELVSFAFLCEILWLYTETEIVEVLVRVRYVFARFANEEAGQLSAEKHVNERLELFFWRYSRCVLFDRYSKPK
jgi:hypothetical protein